MARELAALANEAHTEARVLLRSLAQDDLMRPFPAEPIQMWPISTRIIGRCLPPNDDVFGLRKPIVGSYPSAMICIRT
jgi:hypothetical protein